MTIVNELPETMWVPVTKEALLDTTSLLQAIPMIEVTPLARMRGFTCLGHMRVGEKKIAFYFLPRAYRHSDFWMHVSDLFGGTRLSQEGITVASTRVGLVKASRKRLDAIKIEPVEFEELPHLFQERYIACEKAFCRGEDLPSF